MVNEKRSNIMYQENNIFSCGLNSVGQLGRSNDRKYFELIPFSFPSTVSIVSCGWDFSVAVLNDGSVFAWGSNAYGQLGNKNVNSSIVPVRVDIEPVRSISAGLRHVVSVTVSGKLFGWGSNRRKQLFLDKVLDKAEDYDDSKEICYRPTVLNSVLGGTYECIDCAAGAYHSVIKTRTNQLALLGDTRFFRNKDVVHDPSDNRSRFSSPIWYGSELFDNNEIEQVVCGWSHVLVRTSVGEVYSWGRSDFGQLGRAVNELSELSEKSDEKFSNFDTHPGKVHFHTNTDHEVAIKTIACGSEHSLAIDSNGQLWVWGWNEHGMCGVLTKIASQMEKNESQEQFIPFITRPYQVKFQCVNRSYEVKHIGCGYGHSMAYVEFS
ncbi:unnamed protein product [Schistosoma turkestanicum]|nr:unnamed protein product [Schistosoma turkestanicum]